MNRLQISVITATVGRRELILRKLASLEAQTLAPERFEWIVCINGGDDGTLEELEARKLPFALHIVTLNENLGPALARNKCAEVASGEVLYLSDDDCLLAPQVLELHLEAQETPCVAVGAIRFQPAMQASYVWEPRRVGFWNVNGANTSLPAGAFRKVGGFEESLRSYGGEDILLGYALSAEGLPIVALKSAVVNHLGPDAMASGDLEKAWSAGRNAAHIAQVHPQLAFRLGVHPLLLAAKRATLPLLLPLLGARGRSELAYARGAMRAQREASSLMGRAAINDRRT